MALSRKAKLNFIVDSMGYLAFLFLISTGIIMEFILLPGRERVANDPTTLMSLSRHDWGEYHFWASVIFISAVVIHLFLHWSWLVGIFRNFMRQKPVTVLTAALLLPLIVAAIPLFGARGFEEEEGHSGGGRRNANYGIQAEGNPIDHFNSNFDERESYNLNGFMIRGRTTWREIETETGVKTEEVLSALGIQENVEKDERITNLRLKYDIGMNDIRRVVAQLATKR